MLSYLDTVKTLVNESTYQRGLKYYLEGKVVSFADLNLDFWREYKVVGSEEYIVKIPILHLTLNSKKFSLAPKVIEEMASCTCPYFCDYNKICKHIVAVLASLEQEFGLSFKQTKNQTEKIIQNKNLKANIFEAIFEAEKDKQIKHFQYNWEDYLTGSKSNYNQYFAFFEEFVRATVKAPDEYRDFLQDLQTEILKDLKDYDKEKKIIQIIPASLLVGKKLWWTFWKKILQQKNFSSQSWLNLNENLWKIYISKAVSEISIEVLQFLKNLNSEQKSYLFEKLKDDFADKQEIWLRFALDVEYLDWLSENIDLLDPKILIQLALKDSENREEIEVKMLDKIKVWSDFLQAGDYEEIVEIFSDWQTKLGRSLYFEEALKYFEQNHKKKRKLIKDLKK